MGRKKRGKKPPVPYASGAFFMHQQQRCCLVGGTIENLGEDGSGFHFHDDNH